MGFARGDVMQIGQHRLMCGDAGDPDDVARLFDGAKPDLIFTSPPYLQQRVYGKAIECWDTMMQRVFGAMPHHEKTQVLVNLGLVHRKGEWVSYWDDWIEWMRGQGWRRFSWYVWDKLNGAPGVSNGRLAPSFEFVFHLNKAMRNPNKIIPCKGAFAGRKHSGKSLRNAKFGRQEWGHLGGGVNAYRIANATLRVHPEKSNKTGHPAVFPIALPRVIIESYTQPGESIYDPFVGSGTSILAAEHAGRCAFAMEIEPSYCEIAVQRWAIRKPQQKALAI